MSYAVIVRRWLERQGVDPTAWDDVPDSQLARALIDEQERWSAGREPAQAPGGVHTFAVPCEPLPSVPTAANGLDFVEDQRCVLIVEDERSARLVADRLRRQFARDDRLDQRVGVVALGGMTEIERLEAMEGALLHDDWAQRARRAAFLVKDLQPASSSDGEDLPGEAGQCVPLASSPTLTTRQEELLALLHAAGGWTTKTELSNRFGCSSSTVEKDLAYLRQLEEPLVESSHRGFVLTRAGRSRAERDEGRP